jgi:hypothetical protein
MEYTGGTLPNGKLIENQSNFPFYIGEVDNWKLYRVEDISKDVILIARKNKLIEDVIMYMAFLRNSDQINYYAI